MPSDWDEIDWEDKSGLIAFDEWEKLREEYKKTEKFFSYYNNNMNLCSVGRELLRDFMIMCSEENHDEFKNHIINCHTCLTHIPSKTELEMRFVRVAKEFGMLPYEFYKNRNIHEIDCFDANVFYGLYELYLNDLPDKPTNLLPIILSLTPISSEYFTATWTYLCINCFKRFYRYALSPQSPINIKLMSCCEIPEIRFEKRTFRYTKQ